MNRLLLCLVASMLMVPGCERNPSPLNAALDRPPPTAAAQPAARPDPATATQPAATAPAPQAADGEGISGTVVETMDAGGYTYARVDRGGTSVWLAGPQTKLEVGMALGRMSGSLMAGFHSDTLNRTFDEIYFINDWGAVAPPNPHVDNKISAPATAPPPTEKIAPAPGGKTVAEVFGAKATLTGKQVSVRGKVVKVNNGILGRNWVHLQDGTGGAGTNDLLITTQATATLGDIVVAHGTVETNKDFGAGYRYDVLLEEATLERK